MKPSLALPLLLVFAVAGCRGDDPDEAPPIGAVPVIEAAVAAGPAPATEIAPGDPVATFRAQSASARARLDADWNACGVGTGDADARCRDDAMAAYDDAIELARAALGDLDVPAATITPAGTLPTPPGAELAVAPVSGTRG